MLCCIFFFVNVAHLIPSIYILHPFSILSASDVCECNIVLNRNPFCLMSIWWPSDLKCFWCERAIRHLDSLGKYHLWYMCLIKMENCELLLYSRHEILLCICLIGYFDDANRRGNSLAVRVARHFQGITNVNVMWKMMPWQIHFVCQLRQLSSQNRFLMLQCLIRKTYLLIVLSCCLNLALLNLAGLVVY